MYDPFFVSHSGQKGLCGSRQMSTRKAKLTTLTNMHLRKIRFLVVSKWHKTCGVENLPWKKKNSSNLSSMFLKKEGFERDFFFFGNSCASKGAWKCILAYCWPSPRKNISYISYDVATPLYTYIPQKKNISISFSFFVGIWRCMPDITTSPQGPGFFRGSSVYRGGCIAGRRPILKNTKAWPLIRCGKKV